MGVLGGQNEAKFALLGRMDVLKRGFPKVLLCPWSCNLSPRGQLESELSVCLTRVHEQRREQAGGHCPSLQAFLVVATGERALLAPSAARHPTAHRQAHHRQSPALMPVVPGRGSQVQVRLRGWPPVSFSHSPRPLGTWVTLLLHSCIFHSHPMRSLMRV